MPGDHKEGSRIDPATVMKAATAVLVVGIGGTAALYPFGSFSAVGRCALSVVLGYAVIAAVAFVLAALHSLNATSFLGILAVTGTALWITALWRNRSKIRFPFIAEQARENWIPLVVGAAVILAIVVVRLGYSPLHNLASPSTGTSFRYWGDGAEMADVGRVPVATLQWGALRPPTSSKVMLSGFVAGMNFVLRSAPLPSMGALTWLGALGVSLSLWWVALELGLRRTGPLLVILLCANTFLGNHELTNDLNIFRAETFGRMVAFAALALAMRAARERRGLQESLIAGSLFGIAMATHLVPSAVSIGILAWFCLFLAIRDKAILQVARVLASCLLTAAVVIGAIFFFAGGTLGFGGSGGGGKYQPVAGADPTALLSIGEARPLGFSSGHWYNPPREVVKTYVDALLKGYAPPAVMRMDPYIILLVLLALGGLVIWRCPSQFKPAAAVATGCGINLVVVALAFNYLYDVYVFANFGARRLADYAVLPVLILVLLLVEWAASLLSHPLADALTGLLVVAVAIASLVNLSPQTPHYGAVKKTLAYLDWIKANTPCDSRILSNRRTLGTYQVLTGRASALEGMGPYFRPSMLNQVIHLLSRTQKFFEEPRHGRGFLARQGIDYLVAYRRPPTTVNLRAFPANMPALSRQSFLRVVFQNSQVSIYRVVGLHGRNPLPLASNQAGYRCDSAPIRVAGSSSGLGMRLTSRLR